MGLVVKINGNWLTNALTTGQAQRERMIVSQKYYNSENTAIMERQKLIPTMDGTGTMVDPYRSNTKLPSGFMKTLVEQKVNYSLNSDMTALVGEQDVSVWLGEKWKSKLQDAGRKACINGFAVWQFYMDGPEVKFKPIDSEQMTLCFDGDDKIVVVIRQYEALDTNTGKSMSVAEVWNDEEHWRYENKDGREWVCSKQEYHLVTQGKLGGNVVFEKGKGWGKVPFAVFLNNEKCYTDLKAVKPFIDAYDLTNSDFANNLADFQEIIWTLKNFDGQDIGEFFDNVRKFQAVKVGEGGDANSNTQQVPHEAKTIFLDRLKHDIYEFGMGVNTDDIEGNVTNVRIKSMYSNLDLKANTFEMNCILFLEQALSFFDVDVSKLEVTFDRNMIMNNIELSTLANESIRAVSEETRLSNDPRVKDVKREIELMEQVNTSMLDVDSDTDE